MRASPATPVLRHWTAARDGRPPSWNEDASRYESASDDAAWSAFMVVADGAGSTAFAGEWAQALVDAAVPGWLDGGLTDAVAQLRRSFDPLADRIAEEDDFLLEDLWHERGSAATLIVAQATHAGRTTRCRMLAVGDCLAVVSVPDSVTSFPLDTSEQF